MTRDVAKNKGRLKSGTLLHNGKYVIEKVISSGGFGIVYQASPAGEGISLRTYAIKELFPEGTARKSGWLPWGSKKEVKTPGDWEAYVDMFIAECQVLQSLDFPGIVKIHEAFAENGTAYMVMEYINGKTLGEFSEGCRDDVGSIIEQLCLVGKTLDFVHSRGIVHRDVSPANILVKAHKPYLIDFGISKDFLGQEAKTQCGNPCFMPPEPFLGQSQSPLSDQYSLAATAYFCISGNLPQPSFQRIQSDRMSVESLRSSGLKRHQADAILRAMSLDPNTRFPSLKAFLKQLSQTKEEFQREKEQKAQEGHWVMAAAIVAVVVLGALVRGCS